MAISIERLQEMLGHQERALESKRKTPLVEPGGWWRLAEYPMTETERVEEASLQSKVDLLRDLIKEASPKTS